MLASGLGGVVSLPFRAKIAQFAPYLPTPGQCQHFSTLFSGTLRDSYWSNLCSFTDDQNCYFGHNMVSVDSYRQFKEKAGLPLTTGFTISLLFALLLACFFFYLHFTGSVYASLMLAISLKRSSLRGNTTWHKNTCRSNNEPSRARRIDVSRNWICWTFGSSLGFLTSGFMHSSISQSWPAWQWLPFVLKVRFPL